ncbi:MAG: JAB domain-containing protein [Castellaniella sp.]|uniref:JAB domain-containing protein n=1 Tax=Castellaniella sp. TaxID=1955812 RepID=UPI002A35EC46|nr:JAB domain-containing protein [Castellaniella sp.]MDY0309216.1 JAB domain-containing protein [Castellaniella sp.]
MDLCVCAERTELLQVRCSLIPGETGVTSLAHRKEIDQASVYPRDVVKLTLLHNAKSVMLVHNHPSGSAEASTKMEMLSRRAYGFRNFENYRLRVLAQCGWNGVVNRV